jgi:hypothetical protein
VLDDRDLNAAGAALGDLLGGLGQLADLLSTLARGYGPAVPVHGVAAASAAVGTLAPASGAFNGAHCRPKDDHGSGDHQAWGLAS